MILNIRRGREWIAEKLGREGSVSIATWSKLVGQGLPIGHIGGMPFVHTELVERWLDDHLKATSSVPAPVPATPSPAPRRPRGRPRKATAA